MLLTYKAYYEHVKNVNMTRLLHDIYYLTKDKKLVTINLQAEETNHLISTILDVQPRQSSGGTGKSNDEIVYDLAESILGKLMDKLDIEQANQEMFEPDSKGRLNSLTTVLTQEVDRFNKLLKVIKVRLKVKDAFLKGSRTLQLKDFSECH